MKRRKPRCTHTDTLCPYTTHFRSLGVSHGQRPVMQLAEHLVGCLEHQDTNAPGAQRVFLDAVRRGNVVLGAAATRYGVGLSVHGGELLCSLLSTTRTTLRL